jgi:hypothetical protein
MATWSSTEAPCPPMWEWARCLPRSPWDKKSCNLPTKFHNFSRNYLSSALSANEFLDPSTPSERSFFNPTSSSAAFRCLCWAPTIISYNRYYVFTRFFTFPIR